MISYDAKIMTQKASPSVSLHKSEVTYRDTGISKNQIECYEHELLEQLTKNYNSTPSL